MQTLLEARRDAWQHCSTSSPFLPQRSLNSRAKPLLRPLGSGCPPLGRKPSWQHSICRAEPVDVKEQERRLKEQAQSHKTSNRNGSASQNGTGSASSNGTGNGAKKSSADRTLGSFDEFEQPKDREKGTLDHMLEKSAKAEPSNASRPSSTDASLEETDITPASSWLPYSPLQQTPQKPVEKQTAKQLFTTVRRKLCTVPEVVTSFITFRVQQLMLSNTIVKLLAVFLFATPAVVIGGELYALLTGNSPLDGFLKIYSVLYIVPGVNVLAEDNVPSFVLVNAIFLLGTFTFAVVLGVVSDDIGNELKAIRSGNYPVVIKDHVLLLNWNRQVQPLLRQLALAAREDAAGRSTGRKERGIVVLAQQDKTWMDSEMQTALRGYNVKWQSREGAPYSANDLARVSAGSASTIILLRPELPSVKEPAAQECPVPGLSQQDSGGPGQNIAAQEVAALLSINCQREPTSRQQNIIVQAPEDTKDAVAAAKRVISKAEFNALGLRDKRDMTRLIAQSALQPGVASVQCAILQKAPGSVSFYMRQFDSFEGLEYEDVRRRFSGAVVCGFRRRNSSAPVLNPAANEKLEKGDRIIVLAPRGRIFAAKDEWAPEYRELGDIFQGVKAVDWNPPAPEVRPRKVVIAGWCGEVADLTASLTVFGPPGTEVTMICECAPEGMPTGQIDGLHFYHLPGDPHNTNCLEEAGVARADAIIIGPADDLSSKEADAQMLSELMLVQDILIASKRDRSSPAHVVAVVRCSHTVKVANYMLRELSRGCMTAELIQPDELVSGLIAQVSTDPGLAALLSQTIDSAQGNQVRLREPEAFQLDDVRAISFAEVAERARALQETALGFITRQGALVLAPPAGSTHVFRNTDRVVVIAGKQEESDGFEWAHARVAELQVTP